jgi:cell division protein FtsQ
MAMRDKKWLVLSVRIVLLLSITAILAFTSSKQNEVRCKDVVINMEYENENRFINENHIGRCIHLQFGELRGMRLEAIPMHRIELALNEMPEVFRSEVYSTPDGYLFIHVKQRRPIARVINYKGEGFYFDSRGKIMPLSHEYIARLPVFTGAIPYSYEGYFYKDLSSTSDTANYNMQGTLLQSMYRMAMMIDGDDFWKHLTEQVSIENGNFYVVPKLGNQVINFGDGNRLSYKLHNMEMFYRKGIEKVGWDKYSSFDLRFEGQVIAKKRDIYQKNKKHTNQ